MPAGRPAGRPEISLRKSLRKSLSPAQPTPCFEKGPRSLLENGRFLRPHEAYSFAEIISFIRNLYKWNNFPHLYKWKKNNFAILIRSEKEACMTRPQGQIPISVYIFLSEYHYLGTRKPSKRIYTAITDWGVGCHQSPDGNCDAHAYTPESF